MLNGKSRLNWKSRFKMIPISVILVLVSFIWGTSFIATEIALKEVSVLTLLLLRLSIASIIFIVILLFRKEWKRNFQKKDLLYLLLVGLLSVSFYQLLQIGANKLSNASVTSLFITIHPILLCLFGTVFFREKISRNKMIGILAGFIGALTIGTKGTFALSEGTSYILAFVLIFFNALMWSGYSVLAKKISGRFSSFDLTGIMTVLGFLFFLPFSVPLTKIMGTDISREAMHISLKTGVAVIYLAVVCTIMGYFLWQYCLKSPRARSAR